MYLPLSVLARVVKATNTRTILNMIESDSLPRQNLDNILIKDIKFGVKYLYL